MISTVSVPLLGQTEEVADGAPAKSQQTEGEHQPGRPDGQSYSYKIILQKILRLKNISNSPQYYVIYRMTSLKARVYRLQKARPTSLSSVVRA